MLWRILFLLIALKLAAKQVSKKILKIFIKFPRKKNCQHVLTVKKDLRKTKMEDVDLSGQNKLFIRTCVHIIKYQGLKVKICMVQARSIVPLLWRPQSRLKSVKIVCLCPYLMTSRNIFLTLICHHLNVLFKYTHVFVGLIRVQLGFF